MAIDSYSIIWNYGKDFAIDFFSFIVLALITFSAFRYWRINKSQKKYRFFIASFFLLSLSYIFKMLSHIEIIYTQLETRHIGFFSLTYEAVKTSNLMAVIGILAFRLFTICGLYILYSLYLKKKANTDIILITYLLIISTIFSFGQDYIFSLTAFILLIMITISFYRNYRKTRNAKSRLLVISFATLTVSHLLLVFALNSLAIYLLAEAVQLAGYLILLFTFIKVLSDGKKKR